MKKTENTSRRHFLKSSLVAPVALAAGGSTAIAEADPSPDLSPVLPRRKLGRNGPEVTMLNIGGMMSAHSPQFLDIAWRNGIRYFDTALVYKKGQSEKDVGKWIARYPERRKELFLVTKDWPKKGPEQLLEQIDKRLEACGTDYLDLLFIHAMSPSDYGEDSINWPRSDKLRKVFEKIKEDGKARLCGFSSHDDRLADYLNSAADGGFVDVIMLRYNPLMQKGDPIDQALDRCYDKGIGLVSMKEMRAFAKAPKATPAMEKVGLTTQQAVLHKGWSDKRIASICSHMANVEQIEENVAAARLFKESLPDEQVKALGEVAAIAPAQMCPGCPSCNEKARNSEFAFMDISRHLAYYEQDGEFTARELYRKIPASRRSHPDLDLVSLRDNCQYKVNYPEIIRRAESYFA